MGDAEGQTAHAAAVSVLAGLDMFEIEFGPKGCPGVESVVQAGTERNGPAFLPGIARMVAVLCAEHNVEPHG